MVAHLRKAGTSDEADVAGANNGQIHCTFPIGDKQDGRQAFRPRIGATARAVQPATLARTKPFLLHHPHDSPKSPGARSCRGFFHIGCDRARPDDMKRRTRSPCRTVMAGAATPDDEKEVLIITKPPRRVRRRAASVVIASVARH
ncbi:hypothetical protein TVNIR_0059 [Thioalkalivibrio nitratireducens DSM 14787]|uniref:Uncharacterized protein n=1 Tax=Thioalkalivibrio nitratireducens (strain DSM 14787 / UNIQEM 213 / ALEN2) TaxID=1255043 RepID=L0DQL8_THIND|nr:hypothetical protein TVNIR_0059 [Thioalkalivibrio nitratireducens DSM 14787]